jgi:hypothetical protein
MISIESALMIFTVALYMYAVFALPIILPTLGKPQWKQQIVGELRSNSRVLILCVAACMLAVLGGWYLTRSILIGEVAAYTIVLVITLRAWQKRT